MPFDGVNFSDTRLALIQGRSRVERGWCQNTSFIVTQTEYGPIEQVCMMYALPRVSGGHHLGAARILMEVVNGCPMTWQDMPGRTKEDVLAVYDEAIVMAEG